MKKSPPQRLTTRFRQTPRLRVVCERHPGALSAAVGVFVACGSRQEPANLHGVTHLAEHLFFKGTSRHSAEQISALVERHGGEINAFTDRELTGFHVWVPQDHIEMGLELLFEMLFDSNFDPKECDRERAVVIQELRSYADSPDEEFSDSLLETAFSNHALGRRIAGFSKGVQALSHKKILNYIAEDFLRSEIVISIVSPMPEAQVRKLVRDTLKKAKNWRWGKILTKPGRRDRNSAPVIPANFANRSATRRFGADQVQFAFMYPGVNLGAKEEILWSALANLLGGGSSSHLFQDVREKRGLAYNTHAQLYSFTDVGVLYGYLATDPKRWLEAVAVSGETCRRLAAGITADDLDFVRSMMKGAVYMSYDGINNRMESLARQELLLGHPYTLKDALREVESIKKADLDRVAKVLATPPCFFAFGPVSQRDLPKITKAWKGA